MIAAVATHLVVSTIILALALGAATWIRPLTARTRHAILIAGMAALALPAPLIARFLERQQITPMPRLASAMNFAPPQNLGGLKPSAPQVTEIVAWIWIVVAAVLLLRWWITTQRLVSTAMRAATPPPARAVRVLDDVRRRLGVRRSIDLIASPTCEAPAVARVLRPVIILPADGCESLDDEELRSLLCHECAHVARHDNLLGVAEAVVCSLFWFNPLVWLAHRRIAATREAACDERVADAALPAETYVGALAKVCRALLAPRIPAVSCMASAHLKERIQHLMSYEALRKSAFSHRAAAAASILAVVCAVAAAGVLTAAPARTEESQRYHVDYSTSRNENGIIAVTVQVVEKATKQVLGEGTVKMKPGEPATIRFEKNTGDQMREGVVTVETNNDASGSVTLLVTKNGVEEQRSRNYFAPPKVSAATPAYTGRPISLNLANADIRDLLRTFGELTGMDITIAPEVQGSVSVHFTDVPWDEAFEKILRTNGLSYRMEGKTVHVFKATP